eukprot:scaffold434_cov186-Pinguiococcus_pyrenoidosus.AAC.45
MLTPRMRRRVFSADTSETADSKATTALPTPLIFSPRSLEAIRNSTGPFLARKSRGRDGRMVGNQKESSQVLGGWRTW